MTKTITVSCSGTVTTVTHKTIVVFIPALDVDVDVRRDPVMHPSRTVPSSAALSVGDNATVRIAFEDGNYAVTAATFVPQQDIRVKFYTCQNVRFADNW